MAKKYPVSLYDLHLVLGLILICREITWSPFMLGLASHGSSTEWPATEETGDATRAGGGAIFIKALSTFKISPKLAFVCSATPLSVDFLICSLKFSIFESLSGQ